MGIGAVVVDAVFDPLATGAFGEDVVFGRVGLEVFKEVEGA